MRGDSLEYELQDPLASMSPPTSQPLGGDSGLMSPRTLTESDE
jgi:hypothetical protein